MPRRARTWQISIKVSDMDNINKLDGFGIGELGKTPASTPRDEIEAGLIAAAADLAWQEHIFNTRARCAECGQKISRRLYFSHTAGCRVSCEAHWIEYHLSGHPDWPNSFDGIMLKLAELHQIEQRREKHCARCGSTNANWNPGAGEDLCSDHWDTY